MQRPKQAAIYTAKQILEELDLMDTPFFRFHYNNEIQVIQSTHCGDAALLEVPGFAESRWRYEYTTDEWIPLFMLDKDQDITAWVDMEPDNNPYVDNNRIMYVTPKGFPDQQYYSIVEGKAVTVCGVSYTLPVFDQNGERIRT